MTRRKIDLPVHRIRAWLEPGPIVLVSSSDGVSANVMTMGWHTVMEFTPSLVGCVIAGGNHSFAAIRSSGECVINLPTSDLIDTVVGIGNCSGRSTDKFAEFGLTPEPSQRVSAPRIAECHAHFECRLHDDALIDRYNFFIFEVVKASIAPRPRNPETIHYTGDGMFLLSGKTVNKRKLFRPGLLGNGR